MSYILQELIDLKPDPRIKDWYFVQSPFPTILASLTYVIIVKIIGPELMKNRTPFKLKNIIIFYNAFQVVLSAYLVYALSVYGFLQFNSFFCEPVNLEDAELLNAIWWYYFAKFTEFLDTIFFVMRKKYNQISILHVFHHAIMPFLCWIGVKYSPGGTASIFAAINSFVHVIMYSYYMFAAMGPKYQKYLWWKKYLTVLQIVQFTIMIIHCTLAVFSDCKINKTFAYFFLSVIITFFILFSNFYKESYTKKPKKKQELNNNDYATPKSSLMTSTQYEDTNNLKQRRS